MVWIYLLVTIGCAWFVVPYATKKIQIAKLRWRCQAHRIIVLTYDDGPSTRLTQFLLDILRCRNSTATFFLLGQKLDESKEAIARIISDGHEIGSHSYSHLHAWKRDPISVFLDIHRGLRAVRTMAECHLFRAPYGKSTVGSLIQVWLQGCAQSWWTIDSTDSWDRPRDVEEILNQVRAQGGGVILLHDLDRPGMPAHEKFVLDMTRRLIDLAKNEGYQICKLGEVLRV